MLDAGTVDTGAAGVKAISINQLLTNRVLYWLVAIFSATPVVRMFSASGQIRFLGGNNGLATQSSYTHLWLDTAYGPLPNPFPGGGTLRILGEGDFPFIALRFMK